MRSKSAKRRVPIVALCVASVVIAAGSGNPQRPLQSVPRLVVLLVIDQMPATFIDRFAPYFGENGFKRMLREGRLFANARFAHNTTSTAPGHTVIGSGRYGAETGIVGNAWFSTATSTGVYAADGPVRTGEPPRCAPRGTPVAALRQPAPRNPCWIDGPTLAHRIKARWPKARVVGASVKDRAAILTLGEGADAVYWFDEKQSQRFVTSAFYPSDERILERINRDVLPKYALLIDHPSEDVSDTLSWQYRLAKSRIEVCPDDAIGAHTDLFGLRGTFPHRIQNLTALAFTPYGNNLLADFGKAVIREWNLGANLSGQPDLLTLGFSSSDHVGHLYGPDSCEVADMMARLDRTLEALLGFLDKRGKSGDVVVFVTSDHGVATVPEVARGRGLSAGRVYLDSDGALTVGKLPAARRALERALAAEDGDTAADARPLAQAYVESFTEPFFYLNRRQISDPDLPAVRIRLKHHLKKIEGVHAAWTADEIRAGRAPESVRLGFRADRSGDVVVILDPGWVFDLSTLPMATSHGQPYDYDAQVPVLVWGGGVTPATVRERVDMARVAPTIAALLDLDRSGFAVPEPLPLFQPVLAPATGGRGP